MIPKIVHISWKTKDVVNSDAPLIVDGLKKLIELNPGWDVQISTDEEVDGYLKKVLSQQDYDLVKNIGIVPKTDIWRLLKLYSIGGVYIDIDRLCNQPLDDLIDENTKWVLPTCGDNDFSHDFMMTAPANPVFANVIKLYFQRRQSGYKDIFFLGAQTYMHGITQTIFGEIINTNPGKDKFEWMRQEISKVPFIKIYKESLPNDTVIYKGDVSADMWESMKRQFYAENNVRHWTNEW